MRHPDVPEELRGTYAGLAHPASVEHLTRLGVTAVELLPIHHFVSEDHVLQHRGLVNYWGYNTLGFFAPHAAYSSSGTRGQQVTEFKDMVKALHAAGLEVILDVVYNHTAGGQRAGPDPELPRPGQPGLLPAEPRTAHADYTGCGNTGRLAAQRAAADHGLAALLGHRDARRRVPVRPGQRPGAVVPRRRHARLVHVDDPAGSRAALGQAHRRAVGRGRRGATRWAASHRCGRSGTTSSATACVTTGAGSAAAFAARLAADRLMRDLYASEGRRPFASINFVTAHDGFTMRDLVSYNGKHNEANKEHNRDGIGQQPVLEPRVRGRDRRRRDPRATAAAAAQPADDAAAEHRRPDARRRGRAGPDPARQQQRLLPGQRDKFGSTGPCATTTPICSPRRGPCCGCVASTPFSGSAGISRAAPLSTARARISPGLRPPAGR